MAGGRCMGEREERDRRETRTSDGAAPRRVAPPYRPSTRVLPTTPPIYPPSPLTSQQRQQPPNGRSLALSFTSVAPGVSTRQHVASGYLARDFRSHNSVCASSISFTYSSSLSIFSSISLCSSIQLSTASFTLIPAEVLHPDHTPYRPRQPSQGFTIGPAHPRASDFPSSSSSSDTNCSTPSSQSRRKTARRDALQSRSSKS